MNEICFRAGITSDLTIKANKRLYKKLQDFFIFCEYANNTVKLFHRKRDFAERLQKCTVYIGAVRINIEVKKYVDKIRFCKSLLEDLLPHPNAQQYQRCLKQLNDIMQHCCEEKQSPSEISSMHLAELVD